MYVPSFPGAPRPSPKWEIILIMSSSLSDAHKMSTPEINSRVRQSRSVSRSASNFTFQQKSDQNNLILPTEHVLAFGSIIDTCNESKLSEIFLNEDHIQILRTDLTKLRNVINLLMTSFYSSLSIYDIRRSTLCFLKH